MEKSAAAESSSVSEQPRRSPDADELDGFPVLRAVEEDWDSSNSSKTQHSDDPDETENEKTQQSRTEEGASRNEPSASSQESGGNSREETMSSPLTKIKDEPIDEGYDKALIPQSDISRVKEELENGDQESAPPPDELRISSVFSVRAAAEAVPAPVAASQPPPFPTISQVTSAIKAPLMVLPAQPQTHLQAKPLAQIQLQLPPQIQSQLHIQAQPQPPPPPQLQPPAASIRICCSGCSKVLQKGQTAFQRKGSNQLFCSTVCLTGFTLPPAISIAPKKTCHLCLKVIVNPKDLITVPVDSMNTLKEFCSQACLTIYKSRVEGLNDNIIRCTMCRKHSEIQHEVNHQGVLHKLCSDECFSRFRSSKRLSMSCCEICGNCNVTGNYHLVQVEDAVKKFCSPVCISTFKQKSGKRVHCPCCQEFKCVDQMLEGTNAQGVIEFFCSSRCVTNSQASRTLSGASFPCTNCQKLAIPQFHLAMPDGSIRNFCTYDCVSKFQEKLQRPSPQVNGSSIVTANASNTAPRGPQLPSAAPRPSAPPQIPTPTSNQTTIPPYVPAPGLPAPQDSQQQPNAMASSPGTARLACKQCQKQFSSKPEILQYKNHLGLFCSRLCCDSYKREKDVRAPCEYCKEEKIIKDITMYEHKLRPFCCEGCKLLFKHELSKQHGAQCRVCAYCSNMTHNTIQNHFGGKLEEFCTEECMSLYTVLFYEMAKCYGCKNQGTLSESLKWDGTIKHFCNLHCVLQFCCKSMIPDQPISNGTTAATAAQAPLSLSKDMPIIGGVVSLASALAGNTALTGALPTSNASSKVIGDIAKNYRLEDALKRIMDGNSSDMEQLGEDEEEDVECTPTARIWEKPISSDDEEEENPDSSSSSEDDDDKGERDKVSRKEYLWKRKQFEPPSVEFVECVDSEDSEVRLNWTPYEYFKDFVTEEMLQEVAVETNLYSLQKNGKSVNTNAQEIEQILGMYMHMGLVQMPSVRTYWEMETRYPPVSDVMSRDRFLNLLTLIHFQDNFNVSEDAKKDKVWKLRPWLEQLRQRFLRVPPEECHAVAEIAVPFKGKSQLRCYMPGKPHKWGFKMWGRVGQSGYLYDFDVCQEENKEEKPHKKKSDVGAAGDVVLKMTSTLPSGKNHKVFANDFFTSVPLVEHLKQRGIYYIGTVRTNRVKNCQLMDEKELKTKGRGSLDFRVNQDDNIIVKWYDNKAVTLLSSFVGVEPLSIVKRWHRKTKTCVTVSRPAIVDTYNKFMEGVDHLDMLSTLYKFSFRSRRWYIYIWWHTVTMAVINAWIRYRKDLERLQPRQKPLPLRRFQASVGTALTSAGKVIKKCSRPLSSPEATPTPPRKRKTTEVPPDVRKDGLNHLPTWGARQRCKYCIGRFAHVYCEKCRVHLCLKRGRNCFQAYHLAE